GTRRPRSASRTSRPPSRWSAIPKSAPSMTNSERSRCAPGSTRRRRRSSANTSEPRRAEGGGADSGGSRDSPAAASIPRSWATWARCEGSGEIKVPCHRCGGEGTVLESARLRVKIPPGVETGSRVRLAGQGSPGEHGGETGDLYLRIAVRPHATVRVDGRDLS